MKYQEIISEAQSSSTVVLPVAVTIYDEDNDEFINKYVNITFRKSDLANALAPMLDPEADEMDMATGADVLTRYQQTYADKANQIRQQLGL